MLCLRRLLAPAFVLAATSVSLFGCSGAGPTSVPPPVLQQNLAAGRASASPSPGLIFAADAGKPGREPGAVYAYANTGKGQSPKWSLSGLPIDHPDGLWVDGSGNLYVADESGYVFEYNAPTESKAPGKPNFTYDDPGYLPNHVAKCGKYLYASDEMSIPKGTAAITVWTIGQAKPIAVVTGNYATEEALGYGISCDAAGNVFFAYNTQSNDSAGFVDEYAPGATGTPTTLCLTGTFLQGLTFNASYESFVTFDTYNGEYNGPAFEFYKPSKCAPIRAIGAIDWIFSPHGFAYEAGDTALWDADSGSVATSGALHRFDPKTGELLNTIASAGTGKKFIDLSDVAVSPADHR